MTLIPAGDEVLSRVIRCLHGVIPQTQPSIEPSTKVLELESVDSLVIVSLVDKLEEEFGVEIDAGLISPENFATPGRIAEAVASSLARVRGREES